MDIFTHHFAPKTTSSYKNAWDGYRRWLNLQGRSESDDSLFDYIVCKVKEGRGVSSMMRIASAACLFSGGVLGRAPKIKQAIKSVRRKVAGEKTGKKEPLTVAQLNTALASMPSTPAGLRDKAMLAVGFWGAMRQSEITGLNFGDVSISKQGALVTVRVSKTDQLGQGHTKAILRRGGVHCPVKILNAHIKWHAGGGANAPLFTAEKTGKRLHSTYVCRLVQRVAAAQCLGAPGYGGHSLRAGFVTAAVTAGATLPEIMRQTGHKSIGVLMGYYRQSDPWADSAMARFAKK